MDNNETINFTTVPAAGFAVRGEGSETGSGNT
jgi:hypothetical protein